MNAQEFRDEVARVLEVGGVKSPCLMIKKTFNWFIRFWKGIWD